MFDAAQDRIYFLEQKDRLPNQDTLKLHCLETASLWVMKRRAKLPYLPPQRLPAVARGA